MFIEGQNYNESVQIFIIFRKFVQVSKFPQKLTFFPQNSQNSF